MRAKHTQTPQVELSTTQDWFLFYLHVRNTHLQLRNKKRESFETILWCFTAHKQAKHHRLSSSSWKDCGPLDSQSKQNCPALDFTLDKNILWWIWPLVIYVVGNWTEPMSETLVSNTISCVQASLVANEVSFREWGAFLAGRWKPKRCLKLVLFFLLQT